MPTYRWDRETQQMVKIADRVYRRTGWEDQDKPFASKIMDGYRKVEEKGIPYKGKAANIKRIWGVT